MGFLGETTLIILVTTTIIAAILISAVFIIREIIYKDDYSTHKVHFYLDLSKREMYLYNFDSLSPFIKSLASSEIINLESFEDILEIQSSDEFKEFLFSKTKNSLSSLPVIIKLNGTFNKRNFWIKMVLSYKVDNVYHGYADVAKIDLNRNEAQIVEDIYYINPNINELEFETFLFNGYKNDKVDLFLLSLDKYRNHFDSSWYTANITLKLFKKLTSWFNMYYSKGQFWIMEDLSILFVVPSMDNEKRNMLKAFFEKTINSVLNEMKSFHRKGIHLGMIYGEFLRNEFHINELIDRLFFTIDLAREKDIFEREFKDEDIKEVTHEMELNNGIIQSIISKTVSNDDVMKGINLETNKEIIKVIDTDVTMNKKSLTKKDIKYVKTIHDIIFNTIRHEIGQNKNKIYSMNFSLNYLYFMNKKEILQMFKSLNNKLTINFVFDNVIKYNYEILMEKISLVKDKVKWISLSNVELTENNIPIILNIKPHYLSIESNKITDIFISVEKENILKQFSKIVSDTGIGLILKNPKSKKEIESLKKFGFIFIYTKIKNWKEVFK